MLCRSVDKKKTVGQDLFLVVIHCLNFCSAQLVVSIVFCGTSPSASLASSWSPVSAQCPDEDEGWISVQIELAPVLDVRTFSSH